LTVSAEKRKIIFSGAISFTPSFILFILLA
jgi:hypothetical protein